MLYKHPVLRLFVISTLVMVFGVIGLTVLRHIGAQSRSANSTHPWMSLKTWKVIRLDDAHCDTGGFKKMVEENRDAFIWVDLRLTDVTWQMICPQKKLFELDKNAPLGPSLEDALSYVKNRAVIFNVHAKDSLHTDEFLKIIKDWAPEKNDLGMASGSQAWLRDIRRKHPEWVYVADISSWGKLKLFASFGIETAIDLWPDIFVASLNQDEPNQFTGPTGLELARRQKVLLLDWDGDTPSAPEWKPTLRGILTKRPKNPAIDTFLQKMAE
jgi:hypothetical protein